MKIERRFFDSKAQLRAGDGDAVGTITGVAAVFDQRSQNLGGFFEVISPGAFDDTDFSDVRALFNHDHGKILGRSTNKTLAMSVTERGLEYEITPPDTAEARDVCKLLERGDVDQSSFAFFIAPGGRSFDEDADTGVTVATITKIQRVIDVGPVTYGAYTQTEAGLRSEFVAQSVSEFEAFKRSRDEMKTESNPVGLIEAELNARIRGF